MPHATMYGRRSSTTVGILAKKYAPTNPRATVNAQGIASARNAETSTS